MGMYPALLLLLLPLGPKMGMEEYDWGFCCCW
jgi:hypothetical protein